MRLIDPKLLEELVASDDRNAILQMISDPALCPAGDGDFPHADGELGRLIKLCGTDRSSVTDDLLDEIFDLCHGLMD